MVAMAVRIRLRCMLFDASFKLGPRRLHGWQAGKGADRSEPEPLVAPEKHPAEVVIDPVMDNHAQHALVLGRRVLDLVIDRHGVGRARITRQGIETQSVNRLHAVLFRVAHFDLSAIGCLLLSPRTTATTANRLQSVSEQARKKRVERGGRKAQRPRPWDRGSQAAPSRTTSFSTRRALRSGRPVMRADLRARIPRALTLPQQGAPTPVSSCRCAHVCVKPPSQAIQLEQGGHETHLIETA